MRFSWRLVDEYYCIVSFPHRLFQIVTESVENIRTVQALGREQHFYQQFADNLETPHREVIHQARIQVGSNTKAK